jgi:hypothetical protein
MYYSDHFYLGRGGGLEVVASFVLLKKSAHFKFVSDLFWPENKHNI